MSVSVEVEIDGKPYRITGEDADLIRNAAELYNLRMSGFKDNKNITGEYAMVLSALNIAKDKLEDDKEYAERLNNITTEINNITAFLSKTLRQLI